jgi:hypothetical protein
MPQGARRQYLDGPRFLTVDFIDGATNSAMLTALRELIKGTSNQNSAQLLRKAVTIGKNQGFEEWQKTPGSSQVQILIENRFIVRLLVNSPTGPEEALTLSKTIDWN